ncbi:beta strand repeat-containing protein [Actinoplanes palleronii]|uniref:Fibronectin type-III domain-containing protein n=1 Tax=Actinoplanes palleronii TaxID=113570 RepID=A0ABQ4B1J7_9ACTN|nr:hypothetical protein [Actinoplanes palleronii]GIE64361.1 hypothetical protein Apa02nite_004690 [Actinoplanes palleronii]
MTPNRLFVQSLGGAIVTSAVAAAWLAPGTAFAATATETLSVTGTVQSVVVDPLPGTPEGAEQEQAFVQVDDLLLPVPAGALAGADSGQQATLKLKTRPGTSRAEALTDAAGTTPVAASSTARALGSSSAAVVAARLTGTAAAATQEAAIGSHTLTVLPVFWSAKDAETPSSLTTLATKAKSYWAEQSNGGIAINVDVRDWKQVSAPSGSCNTTAIYQAALAANGLTSPTDATQHVAVYFPKQSGCSWAGLGSVNGSIIWINGYPWEDVLTHEFGHNIGLGHANKATCSGTGGRVTLSTSCTIAEYNDVTDVMGYAMQGYASGNLNSAFGDYLGLAQTVTASTSQKTTVDLSALSTHSGTTGVKLATSAGTVFVDFRPATGRDTRAPYWAGVQAHLRTATNPPTTQLLDLQPTSSSAFSAANLPLNGVWAVPGTNQTVKVTSVGATTATIEVAAAADTTVPNTAPVITTTATMTNTATQTITWSAAADKESGISAYRVLVNGSTAAETGGDTLTADVALAEGTNTVTVVGVNGSGLIKSSAAKSILRDSAAPDAVTALKVAADGKTVSWTAPADKGTTRSYAVRVDGTLTATVTSPTARVSIAAGRRTVSVTPSDAAGNVGTATETTLWIDPSAPVSPVITAPSADTWQNSRQVTLVWSAASAPGSGISSYTVTVGGRATVVDGDTTSTTVTLSADGTFPVTVVAKNLAGVVSKAATGTIKVDTLTPDMAKTIKLATDQSKLTWVAGSAAGSPVSWKVQVDDGAAVLVTKAEAPNTAAEGQHTWTITGVDAAGNTGASATYTAWTDRTAPSAPTIVTPVADSTARTAPVTVTWNATTDSGSGIASYVVTVGTQKTIVPGTTTSYSYKPSEGRQTVSVAAVNNAGLSSPAESVSYTYDPTAPTVPAQVKVSGADDRTVVTWAAATDRTTGIAEYVLSLDGTRVTTATTTTATVTTPPGKHTWTVQAVDNAGNTSTAGTTGPVWFDTTAPTAAQPATVPASQATRAVKVSWSAGSDAESGVKGYTVVASNGSRTVKVATTATTATVTVPEDGSWQIVVQTTNLTGLTTEAAAGAVLVDSAKPGAPVITSPAAKGTTGTSFTVTWTAPAAGLSGITGYQVLVNGRAYTTVSGSTLQAPVTVTVAKATPTTVTVTAVGGTGLVSPAATVAFTVSL